MSDLLNTDSSYVKKSAMYIAIGVSLVVGFLGGVVYNSAQSEPNQAVAIQPKPRAQMPPQGANGAGQGTTSQQASQIMALTKQVMANPTDTAAWAHLGNLYFDTGQAAQAIHAYSKSLELQPGNTSVLTDLGIMYRRNGQPDQAIASFDKAMAIDPQNAQAKFNKGIVLMYDKGKATEAIKSWEEMVKINPGATTASGTPIAQIIAQAKKIMADAK